MSRKYYGPENFPFLSTHWQKKVHRIICFRFSRQRVTTQVDRLKTLSKNRNTTHFEAMFGSKSRALSTKVYQSCSSDPFSLQSKTLQPDYVSSHDKGGSIRWKWSILFGRLQEPSSCFPLGLHISITDTGSFSLHLLVSTYSSLLLQSGVWWKTSWINWESLKKHPRRLSH